MGHTEMERKKVLSSQKTDACEEGTWEKKGTGSEAQARSYVRRRVLAKRSYSRKTDKLLIEIRA